MYEAQEYGAGFPVQATLVTPDHAECLTNPSFILLVKLKPTCHRKPAKANPLNKWSRCYSLTCPKYAGSSGRQVRHQQGQPVHPS